MSYPLGFKQESYPTFLHPDGLPIDPEPFITDFGLELPGLFTASNELLALYKFIKEKRAHSGPLPTEKQLGRVTINPNQGCWELPLSRKEDDVYPPGSINAGMSIARYGRMAIQGIDSSLAHRVMFTVMRGEIPKDLVLDHLCLNKKCCYHRHLEPITQADNIRRVNHSRRLVAGQNTLF